jgi:chromo domain-containing protein 1
MPSPSLSITIPPPPTSRPPSTIPPPPPPETPQSAETKTSAPLTCTKLKSTIESAFNLGFHTLFRTNEDAAILLDRRAFLFFHSEDHLEEIELITRWLLMHHVEVYVPAIEGSWDHFCAQTLTSGVSGIILAHPDFERFWNVPKFGEVLRRNVRVWCVGYQDAFGYDEQISTDLEEKNVDCIEIFPHGGIIYITEDVFEKTPQEALRIIQLFLEKVERCRAVTGPAYDPWRSPALQNGCLLWRLAVRPEFMEWTYQWCEEHEKELEAGDPDAQARAKIYELLSNPEYIEQDNQQNNPERWKPRPDDYYPIISERREVMQEYFYALECGDKEEPMRGQVELFAGTVNALRRDYRHFCVVHTEPGEVDWRKRWQNIDEVMTPAQCISYFEQPAKGNRFESYEWCFPLKEGEEVGKGELEEEEERGRRKTRDGGEVKRDLGTVKEVGDGVMEDVEEEELVSPTVSMDTSSSS